MSDSNHQNSKEARPDSERRESETHISLGNFAQAHISNFNNYHEVNVNHFQPEQRDTRNRDYSRHPKSRSRSHWTTSDVRMSSVPTRSGGLEYDDRRASSGDYYRPSNSRYSSERSGNSGRDYSPPTLSSFPQWSDSSIPRYPSVTSDPGSASRGFSQYRDRPISQPRRPRNAIHPYKNLRPGRCGEWRPWLLVRFDMVQQCRTGNIRYEVDANGRRTPLMGKGVTIENGVPIYRERRFGVLTNVFPNETNARGTVYPIFSYNGLGLQRKHPTEVKEYLNIQTEGVDVRWRPIQSIPPEYTLEAKCVQDWSLHPSSVLCLSSPQTIFLDDRTEQCTELTDKTIPLLTGILKTANDFFSQPLNVRAEYDVGPYTWLKSDPPASALAAPLSPENLPQTSLPLKPLAGTSENSLTDLSSVLTPLKRGHSAVTSDTQQETARKYESYIKSCEELRERMKAMQIQHSDLMNSSKSSGFRIPRDLPEIEHGELLAGKLATVEEKKDENDEEPVTKRARLE